MSSRSSMGGHGFNSRRGLGFFYLCELSPQNTLFWKWIYQVQCIYIWMKKKLQDWLYGMRIIYYSNISEGTPFLLEQGRGLRNIGTIYNSHTVQSAVQFFLRLISFCWLDPLRCKGSGTSISFSWSLQFYCHIYLDWYERESNPWPLGSFTLAGSSLKIVTVSEHLAN